jgi:surface carbohydrate biosynthesis protein
MPQAFGILDARCRCSITGRITGFRLHVKILITYHNFVRDYRGSLLLKYVLDALGHRVWLRPHWDEDVRFATIKQVDVVVLSGQIAEESTSYIARFTAAHGVHLVINSSEQVAAPDLFESLIAYDRTQLNDSVISLQSIASPELKDFIDRHPNIRQKEKYKLLGFPRLDLSLDSTLRHIETAPMEQRYGLASFKKRLLYVSSLLFEEAFTDVGPRDMATWKYDELIESNHSLRRFHEPILESLLEEYLGTDGVLLIKKHPWDMSDRFERRFRHPNVRILGHSEYIVPSLACADAVIHSFSTSALEAWILGKPTISLLPAEARARLSLNHMTDEVFASSLADTLAYLEAYPRTDLVKSVDRILGTLGDGKATIRLAKEIHKLQRKLEKSLRRPSLRWRARQEGRWWLEERGFRRRRSLPTANAKMRRLAEWENLRAVVGGLYHGAFLDYVRRHRSELVG